jgi:uncharacterized membrane protein
MAERKSGGSTKERSPKEELGQEFQHLLSALTGRMLSGATDRVGGLTDKLSSVAEGGGGTATKAISKAGEKTAEGKSPLTAGLAAAGEGIKDKVQGVFGGGSKRKSGGKQLKVTNIVEEIDIGAPVDVVYNQWTQFQDWSNFMKKVENVDQQKDEKLNFKAQVFWSHRSWEATILDQVPNERIIWRSKGEKGRVEGAVTFHEIGPSLTRVLVVLEYYPQGLFEKTGNLWRAQGRRARLELKHFRRHVMTQALLNADDLEGWRGEIHDGEVTRSHEDAMQDSDDDERDDDERDDDEGDDDELDDRAEDEPDEDEEDDDPGDADDEYDDDVDDDYDEDDDSEDAQRPRRRRARAGSR